MHTFILQDWTTIEGSGSGAAGTDIVQSKAGWLDLSSFQDLTFWVDVREVATVTGGAATVTLYLETSPTADESLFQPILGFDPVTHLPIGVPLSASAAPTIVKAPMASVPIPIARFLRWHLSSTTASWTVTFRVLVAANSPGL